MTDRRLYPANARVAHRRLQGQIDGVTFTSGVSRSVNVPVCDLCIAPDGPRDRQRLLGDIVTVLEDHEGWSFVLCDDGYVGYIQQASLGTVVPAFHMVDTVATHAYQTDDFKSAALMHLPFGCKVAVLDERRKFYETNVGFISKKHLRPLDQPFQDPATIAQLHFGVPYLWGGNSTLGIDCSGLIAASLSACGIPCPADSDMQCDQLGETIPDNATLQRGDLIFWQGHVGMMVDADTMIHANAHHMACRYEEIAQATLRIEAQGDGPVIARKRLD